MKSKIKSEFISANIICCLTFSFMLFGCSSAATNNAQSDNVSSDTSGIISEQKSGTSITTKQKDDLAKIYSQAIADYIRLVNKEYKLSFDTLFFGKHVYGQPDDFPDIELPAVIEQTNIKLISPEQGAKKQQENKSSFYINLIAWMYADKAEFTFVTFSNGMAHQFDCFINYKRSEKGFYMESSRFESFLFKEK